MDKQGCIWVKLYDKKGKLEHGECQCTQLGIGSPGCTDKKGPAPPNPKPNLGCVPNPAGTANSQSNWPPCKIEAKGVTPPFYVLGNGCPLPLPPQKPKPTGPPMLCNATMLTPLQTRAAAANSTVLLEAILADADECVRYLLFQAEPRADIEATGAAGVVSVCEYSLCVTLVAADWRMFFFFFLVAISSLLVIITGMRAC
jgi:hypothetical protein